MLISPMMIWLSQISYIQRKLNSYVIILYHWNGQCDKSASISNDLNCILAFGIPHPGQKKMICIWAPCITPHIEHPTSIQEVSLCAVANSYNDLHSPPYATSTLLISTAQRRLPQLRSPVPCSNQIVVNTRESSILSSIGCSTSFSISLTVF
jgi:hypothetical protein